VAGTCQLNLLIVLADSPGKVTVPCSASEKVMPTIPAEPVRAASLCGWPKAAPPLNVLRVELSWLPLIGAAV